MERGWGGESGIGRDQERGRESGREGKGESKRGEGRARESLMESEESR